MKTVELVIYSALALCLVAFAWSLWRSNSNEGRPTRPHSGASKGASSKRAPFTAANVLHQTRVLRDQNAQWTVIFEALNPYSDSRIQQLLQRIRGPHMFDPRTALGVIETGCSVVPETAPALDALSAAVESMNKVVGFGR